jgi:hypothetical protein
MDELIDDLLDLFSFIFNPIFFISCSIILNNIILFFPDHEHLLRFILSGFLGATLGACLSKVFKCQK